MPQFSDISLSRLESCDHRLIKLMKEIIKFYDCTIICGRRGEEDQNTAFEEGRSKLQYPQSKHNRFPSLAVDVAPYISGKGVVWDKKQCYAFGGFVMGVAAMLEIPIRWGGDWDMDTDINDQTFMDLVHFEIKNS